MTRNPDGLAATDGRAGVATPPDNSPNGSPNEAPASGRSGAPVLRLWFAVLFGYLAFGATLQALPSYVTERFAGGEVATGWAVGIAFAATALCRPWAGRAGDTGRARPVMMIGGALIALGGLGHFLAPTLWVLLIARVLMGAGEAALFSAALPWVLSSTAPERRGRVAGWFGLSMWAGLAAGPLVAVAASSVSITWVWPVVLALGVISATVVATTAGSRPVRRSDKPDNQSLNRSRWHWRELVPRGAALPGLGFGLAAYGYGTISALLVLYLLESGRGTHNIGLAVFAGAFLLTRLVASSVVDRFGGTRVAMIVLTVEAVGLSLIALSPLPWVSLPGAALAGIGVSLIFPATVAMTLDRSGPLRPGTSVGVMTSFWDVGMLVAGPISGAVAAAYGSPIAFIAAALACLAALGTTEITRRTTARFHRAAAPPR